MTKSSKGGLMMMRSHSRNAAWIEPQPANFSARAGARRESGHDRCDPVTPRYIDTRGISLPSSLPKGGEMQRTGFVGFVAIGFAISAYGSAHANEIAWNRAITTSSRNY